MSVCVRFWLHQVQAAWRGHRVRQAVAEGDFEFLGVRRAVMTVMFCAADQRSYMSTPQNSYALDAQLH
jgi:hypothetical protein